VRTHGGIDPDRRQAGSGIPVAEGRGRRFLMPALALATSELVRAANAAFPPATTEVAATLPVRAQIAYEVFADTGETPRWLSVIQAAHVLERAVDGRATRVSFRASFERATLGYVLDYAYRDDELAVSWHSSRAGSIRIDGDARFTPLSSRACLMTYRLTLELPVSSDWVERHYDGHAASAVVGDFREHLRRCT
jgi:hypothetical protein